MNVKELIDILSTHPEDAKVFIKEKHAEYPDLDQTIPIYSVTYYKGLNQITLDPQ